MQRLVYDCSFVGQSTQTVGIGCQAKDPAWAGNQINGKYFDKLQNCIGSKSQAETTLIFESRFESGNLARATQISEFEYDLELKPDHGSTVILTQWYYFRVSNTRRG